MTRLLAASQQTTPVAMSARETGSGSQSRRNRSPPPEIDRSRPVPHGAGMEEYVGEVGEKVKDYFLLGSRDLAVGSRGCDVGARGGAAPSSPTAE